MPFQTLSTKQSEVAESGITRLHSSTQNRKYMAQVQLQMHIAAWWLCSVESHWDVYSAHSVWWSVLHWDLE